MSAESLRERGVDLQDFSWCELGEDDGEGSPNLALQHSAPSYPHFPILCHGA